MSALDKAHLLLTEITEALARGTRHYDYEGHLLTTEFEVVCALLRDGSIVFEPAEALDPICYLCGDPKSKHTKLEADWRTVAGCTGSYFAEGGVDG